MAWGRRKSLLGRRVTQSIWHSVCPSGGGLCVRRRPRVYFLQRFMPETRSLNKGHCVTSSRDGWGHVCDDTSASWPPSFLKSRAGVSSHCPVAPVTEPPALLARPASLHHLGLLWRGLVTDTAWYCPKWPWSVCFARAWSAGRSEVRGLEGCLAAWGWKEQVVPTTVNVGKPNLGAREWGGVGAGVSRKSKDEKEKRKQKVIRECGCRC